MPVRPILKMGDARLLRTAQPVERFDTPELHALIDDLHDTMVHAGGVGLAAPQIGADLAVVLFGFERSDRYPQAEPVPRTVLINPRIEVLGSALEEDWEGCLSVPGLRGRVLRHVHIRYSGFDAAGRPIEREAHGFHARVVQHECDHLWGTLYPMRVKDFTSFGYTEVLFPELHLADTAARK
jgi:peptide deformylase